MRENLADFLAAVGSDPDKLEKFGAEPNEQMAGAGLTPTEQAAVASRDSRAVASALDEQGLAVGEVSNGITPMEAPPKKQAPAKKAPKRKAPAKKAPAKKAPAKKAPAKRKAPAKTSRKPAKKSSRKTAKKTARKPAKKAARKPARKSGSRKR